MSSESKRNTPYSGTRAVRATPGVLPLQERVALIERPPANLEDYGGFSFAEQLPGETDEEFAVFNEWMEAMLRGDASAIATRYARARGMQAAVVTQNQWLARFQEAARFDKITLQGRLTQIQLGYIEAMSGAFTAMKGQLDKAVGLLTAETTSPETQAQAVFDMSRALSGIQKIADTVAKVKASVAPPSQVNVMQMTKVVAAGPRDDATDVMARVLGMPKLIGNQVPRRVDNDERD